jgi:CheY-like chemotaxis protein/anti-sigma regulatory factor (Ser/Thr protein kinase)
VIANLLTNAARYSDVGGCIVLSARLEEGKIVIRVRDNGIGMSAELLPRVFELFVQGKRSVDRAEGGLGLGLTLVKSLVTLHGGTVEAKSDGPGKGSEIVVRVPATEMDPESQMQDTHRATRPGAFVTANPKRVLVVDDNIDAADMLGEILRGAGHEVAIANDPIAALDAVGKVRPEVAVLDIGLPGMDGFELAARMRGDEHLRECRFIALTGYGQELDRKRSAAAGFEEHLVKPVDIQQLVRIVERG